MNARLVATTAVMVPFVKIPLVPLNAHVIEDMLEMGSFATVGFSFLNQTSLHDFFFNSNPPSPPE